MAAKPRLVKRGGLDGHHGPVPLQHFGKGGRRVFLRDDNSSYLIGMLDGSVRTIKSTVSDKTLHAAITANGGEILGPDWNQ